MNRNDSTLSGLKVLILDDEPDILEFTKFLLTLYHADVVAAGTAAEGLEQVQIHRPDVIVSDISMPQTDGYQFIRNVRSLPACNGGQTPAVALTALNREEDRKKAIHAGFQRHLPKPVELKALIDTIVCLAGQATH